MPERRFLVVAGDPSGDEHAAALVRALRERDAHVRIAAMGGKHLKAVADHFLYPLVEVGGFGFWEPILALPALWRAKRLLMQWMKTWAPEAVIPVDYYGFNIHVARAARAQKIPVYYYVSPQIWASRGQRVEKLRQSVNRMLVIFPFEEQLYRNAGVPVTFVGHPLPERLPAPENPSTPPIIGLLPGSRRAVVARHLPILLDAAEKLRDRFPALQAVLFRPDEIEPSFYADALRGHSWVRLENDPSYAIRKQLTLAIGVSGTASLENLLLGIPMIIMYRLSWLTYQVAKRLIRIPFVGMPNILAGHSVVPELLQEKATPESLATQATLWLQSPEALNKVRTDLLGLRAALASGGSARAADTILSHATL